MSVLLICGNNSLIVKDLMMKNQISLNIINSNYANISSTSELLSEYENSIDVIVFTDEGITCNINELRKVLSEIRHTVIRVNKNVQLYLFTRDCSIQEIFIKELNEINFKSYLFDDIRISYIKCIEIILSNIDQTTKKQIVEKEKKEPRTKLFEKRNFFMKKQKEPINGEKTTDGFTSISNHLSRTIAITGHRGSGVTSTVVNLATEASNRGMSVIIIDLDIIMRNINLYFNDFIDAADKFDEIHASLVRCLAKPESYEVNACHIKDKFWVIGLPYDFEDSELLSNFYNPKQIIALIMLLKQRFNLVILDAPLEIFRKLSDILIHIDTVGLCVNNNYYSIFTTLRNASEYFNIEDWNYIQPKMKTIITKYNEEAIYNGTVFTAQKANERLTSEISDIFKYELNLAGKVRYSSKFDEQIETDRAIVDTSSEYKEYYSQILLNLL